MQFFLKKICTYGEKTVPLRGFCMLSCNIEHQKSDIYINT